MIIILFQVNPKHAALGLLSMSLGDIGEVVRAEDESIRPEDESIRPEDE